MHYEPLAIETSSHRVSDHSPQTPFGAAHWRRVEAAVALTFAVPLDELRAASRSRADSAFARQVVMYIARIALGLPDGVASRVCRRDRRTVAHACAVVEQRREDPAFNHMLHLLEELCREIAAGRCERLEVRS